MNTKILLFIASIATMMINHTNATYSRSVDQAKRDLAYCELYQYKFPKMDITCIRELQEFKNAKKEFLKPFYTTREEGKEALAQCHQDTDSEGNAITKYMYQHNALTKHQQKILQGRIAHEIINGIEHDDNNRADIWFLKTKINNEEVIDVMYNDKPTQEYCFNRIDNFDIRSYWGHYRSDRENFPLFYVKSIMGNKKLYTEYFSESAINQAKEAVKEMIK